MHGYIFPENSNKNIVKAFLPRKYHDTNKHFLL